MNMIVWSETKHTHYCDMLVLFLQKHFLELKQVVFTFACVNVQDCCATSLLKDMCVWIHQTCIILRGSVPGNPEDTGISGCWNLWTLNLQQWPKAVLYLPPEAFWSLERPGMSSADFQMNPGVLSSFSEIGCYAEATGGCGWPLQASEGWVELWFGTLGLVPSDNRIHGYQNCGYWRPAVVLLCAFRVCTGCSPGSFCFWPNYMVSQFFYIGLYQKPPLQEASHSEL